MDLILFGVLVSLQIQECEHYYGHISYDVRRNYVEKNKNY